MIKYNIGAYYVATEIMKCLLEEIYLIPFGEITDEIIEQIEKDINGDGFNYELYYIKDENKNDKNNNSRRTKGS